MEQGPSKRNLDEEPFPLMKECGQTGLRTHKSTKKQLRVATYNVRTLNNTGAHSDRTIYHKLTQITVGCEKYGIVSIQELRQLIEDSTKIKLTPEQGENGFTKLAHSNSSHSCHGVAFLYNSIIAELFLAPIEWVSDRIMHLVGNPKVNKRIRSHRGRRKQNRECFPLPTQKHDPRDSASHPTSRERRF
jgi:hypothetical protein